MCQVTPSSSASEEKGFDRLLKVSQKRKEWATLSRDDKLNILEEIYTVMTKDMSYEDYKANGVKGAHMMGFDPTTEEGNYEAESQAIGWIILFKKQVEDMISTYKILTGKAQPPKKLTKGNFISRKAINGQIVVETFPAFPGDNTGFLAGAKGEVWMDPSKVQEESQIEAFNPEKAWEESAGDDGGLMIVLGAGNQVALTAVDILQALFMRNYVAYVKQHPLRDYANELLQVVYAPLISRGYLDFELHTTNERCAALVYHPEVSAVHMTGGKATHDLLVWGADPKERERNMKAKTPKLKAKMTSELGAVSPWVVIPGKYTRKELETQAKLIAFFVHSNASCNCNAPKCVVVAEDWDQKNDFLKSIEDSLANHPLPAAYYPGIESRWRNFAKEYPDAKQIDSTTGLGVEERCLAPARFAEKALLLPYLQIQIDVDLYSPVGKETATKEYAFTTEPFAPIYTVRS
jgi:hypothetical protein